MGQAEDFHRGKPPPNHQNIKKECLPDNFADSLSLLYLLNFVIIFYPVLLTNAILFKGILPGSL